MRRTGPAVGREEDGAAAGREEDGGRGRAGREEHGVGDLDRGAGGGVTA